MRRSFFLVLVSILLGLSSVKAQETGEMLRFDNRVKLTIEVTEEAARKGVGEALYRSPVGTASRPFRSVLINGLLPDRNLDLQIRIETAPGEWGDWIDAPLNVHENGRFWARVDLEEPPAVRLQLRCVNRGVGKAGTLEIYAVEVENVDVADPGKAERVERTEKQKTDTGDSVPAPSIVSRQQWGALPPVGSYVPHDPYRFTQHHTAGRRVETLEDGLAEMRFIQDFHQNGRGWTDIGYHYCVDDAGRIYEGVPRDSRGTHVGGANTGNIGISMFGNFEIADQYPTPDSLQSLVAMWAWLASEYGVNPDMLHGHRDYSATSCPGHNFYAELPEMRNGIRKTLGSGGPYVANPEPQPFSAEVSPDRGIAFSIRDEEEGVDLDSIVVRVNHENVTPNITGDAPEFFVSYQPPSPFPSAQNVVVEVEANDLAAYPNALAYSYGFAIEVEALHIEVEAAESVRNADLEIGGSWSSDGQDVQLNGLTDGQRLVAVDSDGSHFVRLYPAVEADGDYRVLMAVDGQFLGESAHYRLVNAAGSESRRIVEYNGAVDGTWAVLGPTPVHFESAAQTRGFIELSGLDGLETRLVLDALRLDRVDRLDPPTAPTLKWVRVTDRAAREVEVAWYPSLEGDIQGYRLFVSEDGRTWGEPLVDESTLTSASSEFTLEIDGLVSKTYVRLVAVDSNGAESQEGGFEPFVSQPTDIYGVGFHSGARVLVVDNFDRRASWPLEHHPFVRSHGDAISANRVGFDSCTETAVQTGEIDVRDYDAVFYICGDDSRADESLAAADQQRLIEYLRGGGKLLISGSEIGYDFNATTPAELERTEDLLKARYLGDLAGSNRVLGTAATPFEGLDFPYGTINSDETYIEDFPDHILPIDGGRTALTYDNSRIAAVSYSGPYGAGNPDSRLVYLAFPFETINRAEDRAALMGRVLQYFDLVIRTRRFDGPPRRRVPSGTGGSFNTVIP